MSKNFELLQHLLNVELLFDTTGDWANAGAPPHAEPGPPASENQLRETLQSSPLPGVFKVSADIQK